MDGGQQRPDQKGLGLEWRPKKKKLAPFLRQNTSCERVRERWLERKRWVTVVARS